MFFDNTKKHNSFTKFIITTPQLYSIIAKLKFAYKIPINNEIDLTIP